MRDFFRILWTILGVSTIFGLLNKAVTHPCHETKFLVFEAPKPPKKIPTIPAPPTQLNANIQPCLSLSFIPMQKANQSISIGGKKNVNYFIIDHKKIHKIKSPFTMELHIRKAKDIK
jgi:hypothetical protein